MPSHLIVIVPTQPRKRGLFRFNSKERGCGGGWNILGDPRTITIIHQKGGVVESLPRTTNRAVNVCESTNYDGDLFVLSLSLTASLALVV
ncbi:hypothetical protein CEXT_145981 [Caerostris extrusa]|uniref:Uncharacterized protein n=1 Tax=Caerostris extrusa TaxID=172846 RepID=A0AAV4VAS1_CAEEX|nr:hypothetical protein CEXT_145981 [Caerostris extrusa]